MAYLYVGVQPVTVFLFVSISALRSVSLAKRDKENRSFLSLSSSAHTHRLNAMHERFRGRCYATIITQAQ